MVQPTTDDGQSRRQLALVIAGLVVVYLCCFWPMFLGRHFLYGDLGNMHLPLRLFYARSFVEGYSPLWIPNLFSGFYLHAEGQVGMFHPAHWLFYRWLPFDAAFALECTLAYPFAWLGMFLFLRRVVRVQAAALLGATLFGFSAYLMVRFMHVNVVAVLAHVPWLMLLVELAARSPTPRVRRHAWVGLALLVGSQGLLGYPGAFVASTVAVGLYAALLAHETRQPAALLALGSATFVGVAVAAVQWIPTFTLFLASNRVDTSYEMLSAQSLHPWNLLQVLSPYLFAQRVYQVDTANPIEQSFYFGALAPVAVSWLGLRWRALDERRLVLGLAGVSAVALILALGRYGGAYWLVTQLPLIGELRNPARFTLFIHVASAIAVAWAFRDALLLGSEARARVERWLWVVPGAATAIAGAALLASASTPAASPGETATSFASTTSLLVGPPLFFVATALWLRAVRGGIHAAAALILFAAADQAAFGATLWWTEPPVSVARFADDTPRGPLGEHGRLAVGYTDYVSTDTSGDVTFHASTRRLMRDEHLVWGWTGLMPERVLPPYVPTEPAADADGLETRLVYAPRAIRLAAATHLRKGKHLVGLPNPLPRFRFVDRVQVSSDVARDIDDTPIQTTGLVEMPVDLEPGETGSVGVTTDLPGTIRLAVDTPSRQLLVIAESFHPGWEVLVDGQAETVLRTYGDFMGVVLDAGQHEVALTFRPRSLRLGLAGSALGLLLLPCCYLPLLRHRTATAASG